MLGVTVTLWAAMLSAFPFSSFSSGLSAPLFPLGVSRTSQTGTSPLNPGSRVLNERTNE